MRRCIELSDVQDVALIFEYSSLVVIDIEIIGCGEKSHHRREPGRPCLSVHAISTNRRFRV